jgi:hypothetical protein
MSNDAGEEVGEFVVGGYIIGLLVCSVTGMDEASVGESADSVSGIGDD